jgi:urease accessory protein
MNSMNRPATRVVTALLLGGLTPVAAMAHPGHVEAGAGFMAGLLHPLSGLDHVLMIVAVSLWAAQLKSAGRAAVAASLGVFVAIGALTPVAPLAGPGLEVAIALTVIGAGILLAAGRRWPLWATASFAALFALIHGFAHGAEGPAASSLYVPGLVTATAGLALIVSFLAARLQTHRAWLRLVGVLGAIAGTAALFNT